MRGVRWGELIVLSVFGVLLSVILIEIASNYLPLFQTDVRFIAEGMDRDSYFYAKFKELDTYYVSADLVRYRVKLSDLGNGYYVRDEPPNGDVFAVAIGDSFTYCAEISIEDCWVNVLENRMGKNIVNLGGPGQFSITEERILRDQGLRLDPELVIWQFMTNDMSEAAYFQYNYTLPPLYEARKFLNANSNVYLLGKRIFNTLFYSDKAALSFEIDGIRNTFNHMDASLNTNNFCYSEISRQVKDSILNAKNRTEDNGSKFLFIMIPMKEEIFIDEFNRHLGTDYNLNCPITEIKEFVESERIDYIDMTEHFEASVREGGNPYLRTGGHLSPEGNRLVAEVIYDFLT